ncbi:MAG: hypothetical protein NTW96_21805 [Planctomycetia bacterium]|nr:hypothetical protein [Planctomycetia bacterium]
MSWSDADVRVLIGLMIFPMLVLMIIHLGIWVFRPLHQAAKGRCCPTQFTIADFLCLAFLVQAATAMVHTGLLTASPLAVYVLDFYAWICCGLIWWKSVTVMSQAGIHRPWHRIVLQTLVFPVTFAASIATLILPLAALAATGGEESMLPLILVSMGVASAVAAGLGLSAYVTRRIVAATTTGGPESDGAEVSRATAAEDAGRIPEAPVESRVRQPDGPL